MGRTSSVSSKGQVTIPQEVRTRLGLRAGDRVEFVTEGDQTIIRPARAHTNAFREFFGVLPHFRNLDEVNAWVRDMRDEEPETK